MALRINQIAVELALKAKEYIAGIRKAERANDRFSKKAKRDMAVVRSSWIGISIAIGAVIGVMGRFLRVSDRQIRANVKLRTALRSTGNAAGLTYEQLKNMASGLQAVTTHGDEAINEAQALMLTFTNIGENVFPQALESVLNVSDAMGTDLQSSVVQIGRALNDPINNLGALTRNGIQFTDQQREQIRTMQASNDIAGAQGVILEELERQFGGMSRAMARTPLGAMRQLGNTLGDMAEDVGEVLVPGINELTDALKESAGEGNIFQTALEGIASVVNSVTQNVAAGIRMLNSLTETMSAFRVSSLALQNSLGVTRQQAEDLAMGLDPESASEIFGDGEQPTGRGRNRTAGGGGGGGRSGRNELAGAQAGGFLGFDFSAQNEELTQLKKAEEERREIITESAWKVYSSVQGAVQQIGQLYQDQANNRIAQLSRIYSRQREYIMKNVSDEKSREKQLANLDQQEELRKNKLLRSGAKKQKEMNSYSAALEIPMMASRAYSALAGIPIIGPILAVAAAGAATIFGLAKLNAIKQQPLPELNQGGIVMGSRSGTPIIAGDRGKPEAIFPLDKLQDFMNARNEQPMNIYLDGEPIFSNVEDRRYKKSNLLGGQNYSFRSVYN